MLFNYVVGTTGPAGGSTAVTQRGRKEKLFHVVSWVSFSILLPNLAVNKCLEESIVNKGLDHTVMRVWVI